MTAPLKKIGSEDKTKEFEVPQEIRGSEIIKLPVKETAHPTNSELEKILKIAIRDIRKIAPLIEKSMEKSQAGSEIQKLSEKFDQMQENHLTELKNDIKEMLKLQSDIEKMKDEKASLHQEIERLREEVGDLKMLHELYSKKPD